MKKLILLIVPALLMFSSCDNKSKGDTATTNDAATAPANSAQAADTTVTGTGSTPAQVFIDAVGTPIAGATVSANENQKLMEKTTSDSKGMYSFKTLVKGSTYTYIATSTGFKPDTMTAVYDGTTNSLPAMAMKAQ